MKFASILNAMATTRLLRPAYINPRVNYIVFSLAKLFREIRQYNGEFWSRFIFVIWSAITFNISIFMFIAIYAEIPIFVRIAVISVTAFQAIGLTVLSLIAARVQKKSKVVYVEQNKLIVKLPFLPILIKLKVWEKGIVFFVAIIFFII